MKKYLYLALLLVTATAFSQETETVKDPIYNEVEVKSNFPGAMPALYRYFSQNYIVPKGFSGSGEIIAQFVVEKDGSITNIKIMHDMGYGTGKEFANMLKKMPKWNPGTQQGIPVRSIMTLPFKFQVHE